uniref:Putative secreted protein n=1 Tax=Ixodes scapularis TaxID=6945 RepID=A0A4D5RFS2_IXOSC
MHKQSIIVTRLCSILVFFSASKRVTCVPQYSGLVVRKYLQKGEDIRAMVCVVVSCNLCTLSHFDHDNAFILRRHSI